MSVQPFSPAQLAGLDAQEAMEARIPFVGLVAFWVQNVTDTFFSLTDDEGDVQGLVPPWTAVTGNLSRPTRYLFLAPDYSLPQLKATGIAAAQYRLTAEWSAYAQTAGTTTLAVGQAVPSVATDGSGQTVVGTITDTVSVANPSGGSLSITGPVTQSGTWDIGTVGAISGTVGISGPVTQSGAWNVGQSGTWTIGSITDTVSVANPSGGVLNITGPVTQSGTWDIGSIAQTVEVLNPSGSPLDVQGSVTQSGTWNIGSITETIQSQIVDAFVSSNPLVVFDSATGIQVANLTAGSSQLFNFTGAIGDYDAVQFYIQSANSLARSYQILLSAFYMHNEPGVVAYDCLTYNANDVPLTIPGYDSATGTHAFVTELFKLPKSYTAGLIQVLVKNVSSGTISSDSLEMVCFARHASSTIVNPTSAPVYQQASVGGFSTIEPVLVTGSNAGSGAAATAFPILAAGNYIMQLYLPIVITANSSYALWITNGSTTIYLANPGSNITLAPVFRYGIYNNGIAINIAGSSSSSSYTVSCNGYAEMTSTIGAPIPATIS